MPPLGVFWGFVGLESVYGSGMATTNLVQGLERMKAARAELEAALVEGLREAPSWLLEAVAGIMANQPQAVEVPLRGGSVAVPGSRLRVGDRVVPTSGPYVGRPGVVGSFVSPPEALGAEWVVVELVPPCGGLVRATFDPRWLRTISGAIT